MTSNLEVNGIWFLLGAVVIYFIYRGHSKFVNQIKTKQSWAFENLAPDSTIINEANQVRQKLQSGKNTFRVYVALVAVGTAYFGVWNPTQDNLEKQRQADSYVESFYEGWDYYCQEVFDPNLGTAITPNGILFAGSYSFTISYCKDAIPVDAAEQSFSKSDGSNGWGWSSVESAREDGLNAGYRESRRVLWSKLPYLCFGTECISAQSEEDRITDANYRDWKENQLYGG